MTNTLSLKRRIMAAQNVSKTTKALQMIAASKLKRAQNAALSSRPYAEKLVQILQNITTKLEKKYYHKYMQTPKSTEKNLVVVFAPDKGLCGGLIANIKQTISDYNSKNPHSIYITIGEKMERYVQILKKEIVASLKFGTTLPLYESVYPLETIINEYFLQGKVKSVKIIYSKFVNVFTQKQEIVNFLPVEIPASNLATTTQTTSLFEPAPQVLLPRLLRHYLQTLIYQNLLESYASEQGARMISMQNATDNALEITKELKLEYNKARQEKITNEILDISSASFSYAYE